jgi:hypothetical protein
VWTRDPPLGHSLFTFSCQLDEASSTIAAAVLIAPAPLTPLNWAGVGVACAGALLYGLL